MTDAVSTLCRACALCCDGTLFAHVTLSPAEGEALAARDLALVARGDGTFRLPQRCRALNGCDCAVYAGRPAACRAYECLLAQALAEGELPLAEALTTVEDARTRLAAVGAALDLTPDAPVVPAIRASMRGEAPALSEDASSRWQETRAFLRRHFTGRHGMS